MNEKTLIENGSDLAVIIGARSTESLEAAGMSLLLIPVEEDAWNRVLSPWKADAVFPKTPAFEGGANRFLEELLPVVEEQKALHAGRLFLCGYSLAGLFALYACTECGLFDGCASVSGSLWYPGWEEWLRKHPVQCKSVYFSLGRREPCTKHPLMKTVGEKTDICREMISGYADTVFEWNEGGHFNDENLRLSKALFWLKENS